jgi:hypothetical protein
MEQHELTPEQAKLYDELEIKCEDAFGQATAIVRKLRRTANAETRRGLYDEMKQLDTSRYEMLDVMESLLGNQ